jgi:mono/diheme cytochrome c family protein
MKLSVVFLGVLVAVLVGACGDISSRGSPAEDYLGNDVAIQRGKLIFAGTCAGYCHKLSSERSDAPYLFDCEWTHGGSDQDIYNTISQGVAGTRMIAFGENFPEGAEDLWKVIAFLKANRQSCG